MEGMCLSPRCYKFKNNPRILLAIFFLLILVLEIFSLPSAGKAQSKTLARLETEFPLIPRIYLPILFGGLGSGTVTPIDTATSTPTETATPTPPDPNITFAVIGDFGSGTSDEADVAALIESWSVDFIITTGDNNYPYGEADTIDDNVGQFYQSYISPYYGSYGPGSDVNRFFPSLGNHDWLNSTADAQPYLDYFTLPGDNERYYDFVWGPVHFFVLDSDYHEPDGRTYPSIQAAWLQTRMMLSDSQWNIVYFHHPPFASGPHGGTEELEWPFKLWGADIVISGHEHNYERLQVDGLTYVVNGLGGDSIDPFQNPLPYDPNDPNNLVESLVRYNGDFGAMRFEVSSTQLSYEFITRGNTVIDVFTLNP